LRDLRDAAVIWRNFLGRTTDYPASGRYDALQKIYHHLLSVLALTFAISGILMWLSAERIYLAGRDGLHVMRWVHDLSASALIVMVVGHIYFSLIKANRANLKDMAGLKPTGRPSEEAAD
jgi:cytochrome b subunit of formate dehydrogenase